MFFGLFPDVSEILPHTHPDCNGKISMKTKVGRNCKEYYERRGWKRNGDMLEGHYQTSHVRCRGRINIDSYQNEFLIKDPPDELEQDDKWPCFTHVGDGWYSVHLHGDPDASAGILSIEQLLERVCGSNGKTVDTPLPITITANSRTVIRARQSSATSTVQNIIASQYLQPELKGDYYEKLIKRPVIEYKKVIEKYQLPQIDTSGKHAEFNYTYEPFDPNRWSSLLDSDTDD
jgi:hypothetical protein